MTHSLRWLPVVATALLLFACGGGGERRLRVGNEPDAGGRGGGGAGSGGGHGGPLDAGLGGDGGGLRVQIEDIGHIAIDVVTVACAGDCVEVEAVARRGNPPYAFTWSDGSTSAARRVCPKASTTFSVSVRDTAVVTDEFEYEAQTASADLAANVRDCSDAGGPEPGGPLCLENASFEGTPRLTENGGLDAAPWQVCEFTPDILDASVLAGLSVAANHGVTYLGLAGSVGLTEGVAQALCAPLEAGQPAHVLVDVIALQGNGAGVLQFFGSQGTACAQDELLGVSEPIDGASIGGGWTTLCVTLIPTFDVTFLKLAIGQVAPLATSYIGVDNLRPVAACP